jgi:electron transport complex protein RnfB
MEGIIYPAFVMGGLGLLFGALLAFASKAFFVETDPRQAAIRELLPGANCGGCGYPGCDGYAEAIVAGDAKANLCGAGGTEMVEKISEIMGVAAEVDEPKVAFLACKGSPDKTVKNCVYMGVSDCREAAVVPGKGPTACAFGCMGLGTCVDVCMFHAIKIENGLAKVDIEKCVGCGACVQQCPRNVLKLIPRNSKVTVACNSPLKGPFVKKVCSAGCIGCTLCVKACPVQAIEMKGALAVIDPAKCINCGKCAEKCPVKCISDRRPPRPAPKPKAPAESAKEPVAVS